MNYPGKPLKRGDTTPVEAIKAVQAKIVCKQTGVFGPTTETLLKQWQAKHRDSFGHPLVVDGQVGPVTWATMFGAIRDGAAFSTVLSNVLTIASAEVGQHEEPRGSNSGPRVDLYLKTAAGGDWILKKPAAQKPWCVAFAFYCVYRAYITAGLPFPFPNAVGLSSSAMYDWAVKNGIARTTPLPGDIGLVKGGKTGHYHTVIVEAVEGGYIHTIEGNSNDEGSAEGYEVCRLTRKANTCDFVRYA